jgi:hypothetical protein
MKTIDTTIEIDASPSRVWEVLMDFPRHSEWNPFIASVAGEPREGGRLVVRIQPPGGGGMTFKPVVLSVIPEREFRWKGKFLVSGLFNGEHYFRIEPTSEGTRFHHGETFTGLLVPLLGSTLESTEHGFRLMNEALKRRAEG